MDCPHIQLCTHVFPDTHSSHTFKERGADSAIEVARGSVSTSKFKFTRPPRQSSDCLVVSSAQKLDVPL